MILTCPNCSTRFVLSAFVLAPEGRKVKCSNCGERWFQLPDPEELNAAPEEQPEEIPESVKPVPKGSSVPAIKDDEEEKSSKTLFAGVLATFLVFVLTFVLVLVFYKNIVAALPASLPLFNSIGVVSTLPGEGLVFDRLEARASESSHEPKIFLSGAVINLTPNQVSVPPMLAEFRDNDGAVLREVIIDPPADILEAEGTLPFEAVFDDSGDPAQEIFIRFTLSR